MCRDVWHRPGAEILPETDDFPFPYLVGRGIPPFYQLALLLILVGSLVAVRFAGGPFREMRTY